MMISRQLVRRRRKPTSHLLYISRPMLFQVRQKMCRDLADLVPAKLALVDEKTLVEPESPLDQLSCGLTVLEAYLCSWLSPLPDPSADAAPLPWTDSYLVG